MTSDTIWLLEVSSVTTFLFIKRKKIVELAEPLFDSLDFLSKNKLTKQSLYFSLAGVVYLTVNGMLFYVDRLVENKNPLYRTGTVILSLLESPSNDVVMSACSVYFIFLRLLYVHSKIVLFHVQRKLVMLPVKRSLVRMESGQRLDSSYDNLYKVVSQSVDSMKEFDRTFSFLPFITIMKNFLNASYIVISLLRGTTVRLIAICINNVVHNTILILIITYLTRQRVHLENKSLMIRTAILEDKQSQREAPVLLSLLIESIKEMYSFQMTGWEMFALHKSLILAFMANVISFTVLFVQLTVNSNSGNSTAHN